MSNRYKKSYAERLVSNYIEEIERQRNSMRKNFEDMDFVNANARDEFEKIVTCMTDNCNSLINEINGYSFY